MYLTHPKVEHWIPYDACHGDRMSGELHAQRLFLEKGVEMVEKSKVLANVE
jgi:hypothetical protein